MKLNLSYIIRRIAIPMLIGAFPTAVYHFYLTNWQWWAIALPLSFAWTILDNTLVEPFIEAWKERHRV